MYLCKINFFWVFQVDTAPLLGIIVLEASEMAQGEQRCLLLTSSDLSAVFRTQIKVEGENWCHKDVLWPLQVCHSTHIHAHTLSCTHTITIHFKIRNNSNKSIKTIVNKVVKIIAWLSLCQTLYLNMYDMIWSWPWCGEGSNGLSVRGVKFSPKFTQ